MSIALVFGRCRIKSAKNNKYMELNLLHVKFIKEHVNNGNALILLLRYSSSVVRHPEELFCSAFHQPTRVSRNCVVMACGKYPISLWHFWAGLVKSARTGLQSRGRQPVAHAAVLCSPRHDVRTTPLYLSLPSEGQHGNFVVK